MEKQTVIRLFQDAVSRFKDRKYVADKTNHGFVSKSYGHVYEEAGCLATWFLKNHFVQSDTIAILSESRSEWVCSELGIVMSRCIAVPLSIKLMPGEILFRLTHSQAKAIVVSRNTVSLLTPIIKEIEVNPFTIIYLDDDITAVQEALQILVHDFPIRIESYNEMILKGREFARHDKSLLEKIMEKIEEEDVVTISYTSGTTGNPKGIMLTHRNYYSNTTDTIKYYKLPEDSCSLVILPIDHSFAHTVMIYGSMVQGWTLYFVDSRTGSRNALKNIPLNLTEVNPTFLLTVPALSRNFMNKIIDAVKSKNSIISFLFELGITASYIIHGDGYNKPKLHKHIFYRIVHACITNLIFKKVRTIFGNSLLLCVSGGALCDIGQQRFFYALGIPLFQGYGLTEASPIISVNSPEIHKIGSSGRVIPKVQCKIIRSDGTQARSGEKGEIVIHGANVMKGYFRNPDATAQVLKNGWLHTGDLGYVDDDNFLFVTGREKALLISQDGEKYSPEEIEEAVVQCSTMISQVFVYNDHNRYTSALITLDVNRVKAHIHSHAIKDAESLIRDIKKSFYHFKEQKEYKNRFPDKWIPSTFRILKDQFSEQNNMVNSTGKVMRFAIIEAYRETLESMHSTVGTEILVPHNIENVKHFFNS